jgi:Zn-dependent protease with chaperone function
MSDSEFRGAYFDGRSARRNAVTIRLGADGIELIATADGAALLGWRYADLRLASVPGKTAQLVLRNAERPDERLVAEDPTLLRRLETKASQLYRASAFKGDNWRIAAWCLVAGALLGGSVWGINRLAEPIATRVPLAWERPLGLQVIAAVTGEARICDDPGGARALDVMIARLTANGPLRREDVDVRVVDDKRVNAFAAPGGEIVILRGLIDAAQSADEVAGVLAHEMGHVLHRHPTKMLVRVMGADLLLQMVSGNAATVGAMAVLLTYSRDAELEADREAVALLHAAGAETQGLEDFFARAAGERGGVPLPAFLSTHPSIGDRIAALKGPPQATIGRATLDPADWARLKSICAVRPSQQG